MGGPGRAGQGQQWAGPKPGRAKILTAQPALKTGPVGPNSHFKAKKKFRRAGSGHTGLGHTGPSQIWPGFFRAKYLMAQPGPNFGRTGLAHRAGPILPPLITKKEKKYSKKKNIYIYIYIIKILQNFIYFKFVFLVII